MAQMSVGRVSFLKAASSFLGKTKFLSTGNGTAEKRGMAKGKAYISSVIFYTST